MSCSMGGSLAIMQPYFFPYVGYFQLMQAVDTFIVYDKIKYTKKGWINRNRILSDGRPLTITVPLKKASDFAAVDERELADSFERDRNKILGRLEAAYRGAPNFGLVFDLVRRCLLSAERNLFRFVLYSIRETADFLRIPTEIVTSSEIEGMTSLTGQDRVVNICKRVGAQVYVNPVGGRELYEAQVFAGDGIELQFLEPVLRPYPQFGHPFVGHLSIVDMMMFLGRDEVRERLNEFSILQPRR